AIPVRFILAFLLYVVTASAIALEFRADRVRIPVEAPGVTFMTAGVFLPSGDGPFPVVVYSHGRSGTELERAYTKIPDERSHIRYWLRKGFAVIAPIRPGYGETGGVDREDSGVRLDMFGNCWGYPKFDDAAAAAASALRATIAWAREQPWADANR